MKLFTVLVVVIVASVSSVYAKEAKRGRAPASVAPVLIEPSKLAPSWQSTVRGLSIPAEPERERPSLFGNRLSFGYSWQK
jgi:hypothetical protein